MFLVNTVATFGVDFGTGATVGTVTVDIKRGDGTLLVDDGATTDVGDGTYTFELSSALNNQIDQLKLEWTIASTSEVVITYEEIVGALLFTIAQAREFQAKADTTTALKPLASSTEYPDSVIAAERVRITKDLEAWTGRGWIPRYSRVEAPGGGRTVALRKGVARTADGQPLDQPGRLADISTIISVTDSGTAKTVTNFTTDRIGRLISTSGSFTSPTASNPYNVEVEYVYGLRHISDGVDRIAMKLLVDRLVPSAFPDRALTVDTDYGTTRFVQPGGPMNNVSRIPEVNQWVIAHDHRMLVG